MIESVAERINSAITGKDVNKDSFKVLNACKLNERFTHFITVEEIDFIIQMAEYFRKNPNPKYDDLIKKIDEL